MRALGRVCSLALISLSSLLSACGGAARPTAAPAAIIATPAAKVTPIRIGIALGGGAAKGFAHIGVIKILEANGITPTVVAGTSAGSVVGALYASGMDAFAMQEKAVALDETGIRDVRLFSGGLVEGKKLQDYVNAQVGNTPIDKLSKPFAAVATCLEDGKRTVFVRGDTGQAVRASSSIPGVFEPVAIGRFHYVDGSVVSPVPVDAARQLGAAFVIAVDISNKATGKTPHGLLGTVSQSIAIMGEHVAQAELQRADIVIRPEVHAIGAADFYQRHAAILEGERAAMAVMPQIRSKLAQLQAQRSSATRTATEQAAAAEAETYLHCLENRSRWQKLRGKQDGCMAPPPASGAQRGTPR